MDKVTYLAELAKALGGLSEIDRQNTLAYYNEFLNDAESEGETDANALLGSPHTLAAQIKADIAMEELPGGGGGAVTTGGPAAAFAPGVGAPTAPPTPGRNPRSGFSVVWTVILAILAIPIGVPLAVAVIAVIFSVLVTLVALLATFAAVVVSLLAVGVLSGVIGFYFLFSEFSTGVFYLGMGFAATGASILCGMAFWKLGKLSVRGVARLFNAIRKKLTRRERSAQ
jgi:uncharacterized membrane protein